MSHLYRRGNEGFPGAFVTELFSGVNADVQVFADVEVNP